MSEVSVLVLVYLLYKVSIYLSIYHINSQYIYFFPTCRRSVPQYIYYIKSVYIYLSHKQYIHLSIIQSQGTHSGKRSRKRLCLVDIPRR